jgi:hypothetical protein
VATDQEKIKEADANAQSVMLAGAGLAHLAGNLSAKFDTFATWLLAGFGAAIGLLLTNHDVSALIPAATLRSGTKLFLWAVVVTVVEKYLYIIVAGGAEGAEFARTSFNDHFKARREQNLPVNLNIQLFIREMIRPLFKPALWVASRLLRKIAAGDTNAGARMLVVISQIQGALMAVDVVLFVAGIWQIVAALPAK